jgi:hypothetical protein
MAAQACRIARGEGHPLLPVTEGERGIVIGRRGAWRTGNGEMAGWVHGRGMGETALRAVTPPSRPGHPGPAVPGTGRFTTPLQPGTHTPAPEGPGEGENASARVKRGLSAPRCTGLRALPKPRPVRDAPLLVYDDLGAYLAPLPCEQLLSHGLAGFLSGTGLPP